MSNFVTAIPVHINRVAEILPTGSTIVSAKWNAANSCVELEWYNGRLKTKYSWPMPFSLNDLENHKLPSGIETEERKGLTPSPVSPMKGRAEKLDKKVPKGKTQGRSADKNAVAGNRSAATSGLPEAQHGQKT